MSIRKIMSSINTVDDEALFNEAADNVPTLLSGSIASLESVAALRRGLDFLNQDDSQIHPEYLELCNFLRQNSADKRLFLMQYFNETFTYEVIKTVNADAIVACLKLFNDLAVSTQPFLERFSAAIETGIQKETDINIVERLDALLNTLLGEAVVHQNHFLLENTRRRVLAVRAAINDKKSKKNANEAIAVFEANQAKEKERLVDELAELFAKDDIFSAKGNMPSHLAGVYLTSMAFSRRVLAHPDIFSRECTAQDILRQLDIVTLREIEAATEFIKNKLAHPYDAKIEGWSLSLYKKDSDGSIRYPILQKHPGVLFLLPAFNVSQRAHHTESHANTIHQSLPDRVWRKIEAFDLGDLVKEDEAAGPSEDDSSETERVSAKKKGKQAASPKARTDWPSLNQDARIYGTTSNVKYSLRVCSTNTIDEGELLVDLAVAENRKYNDRPTKTVLAEENRAANKIREKLAALGCVVEHKAMTGRSGAFNLEITPKPLPNLSLEAAKKIKEDLETAKDSLRPSDANKTLLKRGLLSFFETVLFRNLMTTLENKIDELEEAASQISRENDIKIAQSKDALIAYLIQGAERDAPNEKWKDKPENIILIKNTVKTLLLESIRKNNIAKFSRLLKFYNQNATLLTKDALPSTDSLSRCIKSQLSNLLNGKVTEKIEASDLICQLLSLYNKSELKSALAETIYQHVWQNILHINDKAESSLYLQSVKVLWALMEEPCVKLPKKLFEKLRDSLNEGGNDYTKTENVIFCIKLFFSDKKMVSKLDKRLRNAIEDAGSNRLPRTWVYNAAPEAVVNYLHDEFGCDKPWPTWAIILGGVGLGVGILGVIIRLNQTEKNTSELQSRNFGRISSRNIEAAYKTEKEVLNGPGIYKENGYTYDGIFQNGIMVRGRVTHKNGEVEDGEFFNWSLTRGYHKNRNGEEYNGVFEKGLLLEGDVRRPNGEVLKGTFDDEGRLLKGEARRSNGEVLEGTFEKGLLVKGSRMKTDINRVEKGEFKDNQLHGECEIYEAGKLAYKGTFVNGDFVHGELHTQEAILKGDFKNSELNGEGEVLFRNGARQKGYFKDNKLHGPGEEYSDTRVFKGDFKNGLPIKGKTEFINGLVLEGRFDNDVTSGEGTMTYIDKKTFKGTFQNAEPVSGTLTDENGNTHKVIDKKIIKLN